MDLSDIWASLDCPPLVGGAMRRAIAATKCHSGKAASDQPLKVENFSGAK